MTADASPRVILHLGLGAFHRAHQAVFVQRLHDAGDAGWSLVSGNIRPDPTGAEDALARQGGAYILETVTPAGERHYQRIAAIRRVLRHEPGLAGVIAQGTDPATGIVTFTVTEAGYYLDSADRLELAHAEVASDLEAARAGRAGSTLYGTLAAILRARMHANAGPLTLLSCDNLRRNGDRSRTGLLQFIEALGDVALARWVEAHTSCPNAMVDRITPRPSAAVALRVRAATGRDDEAALMAESFIQWVIEDDFIAGRPTWDTVGVEMVASVAPYEEAKIRLLNASHSCIAWAGTLAGHAFIDESTRDAAVRRFAVDYATVAAIPALGAGPIDLAAYRDVVLDRFANAAIRDSHERVVADSFAKLAGFVAPTVVDRLGDDAGLDAVAALPALFLALLQRWQAGRLPFAYRDQPADLALAHRLCTADDPLGALAASARLWGTAAGDERWLAALRRAASRVAVFEAACAGRPPSADR